MTIFHQNRECRIHNGNESSFKELQKLATEMPEVKEVCRAGILIVFEDSREEVVPIEELIFS